MVVRSTDIWLGRSDGSIWVFATGSTQKLLHEIQDRIYKYLRIFSFWKLIFGIGKTMKSLVSVIMRPTKWPLTVIAGKVLVKTVTEGGTCGLSDVVGLYKCFIVFEAEIFLDLSR